MQMGTKRLSNLHTGESAVIVSFLDDVMKQKLFEMGFLPGDTVTVNFFAPLGCPIAYEVNGTLLGIRKDEAESIIVKPIH